MRRFSFISDISRLTCDAAAMSDILTRPLSPEPASSSSQRLTPVPTQLPETSPSPHSANDDATPPTKKKRSKAAGTGKAKVTTPAVGGDTEGGTKTRTRSQRTNRV